MPASWCFDIASFTQPWEQKLIKNEEDLLSVAKKPKRREQSEGRTAGGLGGSPQQGPDPARGGAPEKLAFLRFIIVNNAISLQEMQDIPDR